MPGPAAAPVTRFMLVMAAWMAGIWTIGIRSPEVDRSHGLLRARDCANGQPLVLLWPAEHGTAALLLAGVVVALPALRRPAA